MAGKSIQVPFRITDINLGFQEAEGLIRFECDRVVIEYKIKDALGLSLKRDIQEIHLALGELCSMEIRDWWITMRLKMTVRSMHAIQGLPNVQSAEVTMKISRKHRQSLLDFVSATRFALSEYRLNQLEG